MVSEKATIAIVAVSGFLGSIVAISFGNWTSSAIHLLGPVYFSPRLALVVGFAFVVIFGILYAFVFYATTD